MAPAKKAAAKKAPAKKAAAKKAPAKKAAAKKAPAKKAAAKKQAAGRKITKQNDRAWWCPECDHSNALLERRCGGCGVERDGDTVKDAG